MIACYVCCVVFLPCMINLCMFTSYRISAYSRSINNPYRSSYQSAYVPYYRRQQEQNERREKEREAKIMESTTTTQPSTSTATSVSATLSSVTTATTTVSTHGVSSIASCPTFGTNSMFRRFVVHHFITTYSLCHSLNIEKWQFKKLKRRWQIPLEKIFIACRSISSQQLY